MMLMREFAMTHVYLRCNFRFAKMGSAEILGIEGMEVRVDAERMRKGWGYPSFVAM
jgi:hypothetical protein